MVIVLVLLTALLLILIDIFFLKEKVPAANEDLKISSPLVFSKNERLCPDGYYYSSGHTWAKPIKDIVKVGIDDFVIKALGKVKLSNIAKQGTEVKKGDVIFEAEFNKSKINFRSPIDGTIININRDLLRRNIKNPYDEDWGAEIKPSNMSDDLKSLISGKLVMHWMKSEFKRLKDLLVDNSYTPKLVGVTMYDGGNIVEGAVSMIDEKGLKEFEEKFLKF